MEKNTIQEWSLLLFPFSLSLPVSLKVKSITLVVFFLILLMNFKWKNFKFEKNCLYNLVFTLFISLFLVEILIGLLTENRVLFHEVRLSFLIAPILFYVSGKSLIRYKEKILASFIVGVFVYVFYSIGFIFYFYFIQGSSKPFEFNYYLKYVLYNYMPGAMHHTYIGMYACFALTIILIFSQVNWYKKLIISIPLLLLMPFIGSKTSLFVTVIVILVWLTREFSVRILKWVVPFIVALALSILLYTDIFRTFSNSFKVRLSLLKCTFEGIGENFMFGIGRDEIKTFLATCTKGLYEMDTHNMYVQELLSSGILSLVILILLLGATLKLLKNNLLAIMFLCMFMVFGVFEHLLNMQLGVTYFVFFSMCFVVFTTELKK
ncbi:hypothetical protein Q4603_11145 [Zobellia galactanivorans]|uniref:hypothetical protein n=1 Tax=Zobellia galactanivorans (strain DSM 12802 / CCUG 47099 / CIP 106680 / NCIMB 13871 / Dsij) TaxID=63186 RepID=UPI0026E22F24|nr:hypothetical protein [Zobellia galactanivorans]MDO6809172.1 hypothetical protein [Zobellia galactanivorans]